MAEYNGVHVRRYTVRGVEYVGLWWYVGSGSRRDTKALGAAKDWTKARLNKARLDKEKDLALQPGMVGAGKAPTLGAWFEQWKRDRTDVAGSTVVLMEGAVNKLVEFGIGLDRRIDKITRAEASAWRAWLSEQGLSEATVCKYIRCASSMFGTRTGAASLDLIPFNPFARLKKNVKLAVKGFPELSEDDEDRLIQACPSPAWRAWVAIVLLAGARRAEPLSMLWSRVRWGEGQIDVPNLKTSRDAVTWRTCKMTPRLERVLLECHEQAEHGQDRIVPLEDGNASRDFETIIKRAGLDVWPEKFKALRRRRVSLWKSEYPAAWVDLWLGHTEAVSREHYLSVPADAYVDKSPALKRLVEKLGKLPEPRLEAIERMLDKQSQRSKR